MSLLKVNDLKVHYPIRGGFFRRVVDHVRAVDGVSFELSQGRHMVLLVNRVVERRQLDVQSLG